MIAISNKLYLIIQPIKLGANCRGANCRGANCRWCELSWCELSDANCRGANCRCSAINGVKSGVY